MQAAVDTKNDLIVAHEVTKMRLLRTAINCRIWRGRREPKWALRRSMLSLIAATTQAEIRACEEAGIAVTLPKPMTSNSKAERAVRQAGLPLPGSGGCLRLSGRTKACIFLHGRGQRLGATSLPDQRLSELRYQA